MWRIAGQTHDEKKQRNCKRCGKKNVLVFVVSAFGFRCREVRVGFGVFLDVIVVILAALHLLLIKTPGFGGGLLFARPGLGVQSVVETVVVAALQRRIGKNFVGPDDLYKMFATSGVPVGVKEFGQTSESRFDLQLSCAGSQS